MGKRLRPSGHGLRAVQGAEATSDIESRRLHVTSAHRTPARTVEIIRTAPEARGVQVFIAGAGSAPPTSPAW